MEKHNYLPQKNLNMRSVTDSITALRLCIINNNIIKVLCSARQSTKQGTQGAEYVQTFRKIGY